MASKKNVKFQIGDSSSESGDSIVFQDIPEQVQKPAKKTRQKRVANITKELEPFLDPTGSLCLHCNVKTKDVDAFIQQSPSRKPGGVRESTRSKCGYCGAKKNIFLTLDKTREHSSTGAFCFTCRVKTDDIDRVDGDGLVTSKCSICGASKALRLMTNIPEVVQKPEKVKKVRDKKNTAQVEPESIALQN